MTSILAIDTPAEREVSCTGWAFGEYEPQTPFRLLGSGVIEGGFAGFAEEVQHNIKGLGTLLRNANVAIVEHYVPYNRAGDVTPLLAEGVVRYLRPDVVLQRSSVLGKGGLVSDNALKTYGVWSSRGHHHDERSAVAHALYYVASLPHAATLRKLRGNV